jgi:hypothetical protein
MWFPGVVWDRLDARPTLAQSSVRLRATASFRLRAVRSLESLHGPAGNPG